MNLEQTVRFLSDIATQGVKIKYVAEDTSAMTEVLSQAEIGDYIYCKVSYGGNSEGLWAVSYDKQGDKSNLYLGEFPVGGPQGIQGDRGPEPAITIGSNGHWYVDGVDTGKPSRGEKGETGNTGAQGAPGQGFGDITEIDASPYTPMISEGEDWDTYTTSADIYYTEGGVLTHTTVDFEYLIKHGGYIPEVLQDLANNIDVVGTEVQFGGNVTVDGDVVINDITGIIDADGDPIIPDPSSKTGKYLKADSSGKLAFDTPVAGTNDGTNWTTITIAGNTKNIPSGGGGGAVSSVNGKTGAVVLKDNDIKIYNDGSGVKTVHSELERLDDRIDDEDDIIAGKSTVTGNTIDNVYWNTITIDGNTKYIPVRTTGVNDGTNWTSLTVNGVTKAIPAGGGGTTLYYHDLDVTWHHNSASFKVVSAEPNKVNTLSGLQTLWAKGAFQKGLLGAWLEDEGYGIDGGLIDGFTMEYGNMWISGYDVARNGATISIEVPSTASVYDFVKELGE